jgi:hypothetical protein
MKIIQEGTTIPRGFSRTRGSEIGMSTKVWAFYCMLGSWSGRAVLFRCYIIKTLGCRWYKTEVKPYVSYSRPSGEFDVYGQCRKSYELPTPKMLRIAGLLKARCMDIIKLDQQIKDRLWRTL